MARRTSSPDELPEGLLYQAEFITKEEEQDLLRTISSLNFRAFEFQGYTAKRRVVEYGWEYDFSSRRADETIGIPEYLRWLRERSSEFVGIGSEELVEAIVTEYPPGAPIGWHRDVPQFEIVIGVSLGSACRMRFKPYKAEGKLVSIILEPRSIYVLTGVSRWKFQHSIPPVEQLRYSVTFRTLRGKNNGT
jgi:alkylated DNA repair dioxygenase AlkB